MSKLFLLDFDETLFNTTLFKKDLTNFLAIKYSIDFFKDYDNYKNEYGAYDYFTHILHLTKKKNKEELLNDFYKFFEDKNYEFDDVQAFLRRYAKDELVILTVAIDNFQNMKINICPNIKNLKRMIILKNKAEFIKQNIIYKNRKLYFHQLNQEYDEIIFIEDQPKFLILKKIKNFFQFRMKRPGTKYYNNETPDNITEIKTLEEINV